MADRYWVGGSDTWDATAGSKWALTSGGAGGEAVPTSADDVYIDSGSGAVTVTVGASSVCKDLKFISGAGSFAGTFAGSSTLSFYGDLLLSASMTWTYTGALTAASTTAQTITSNGKALTCPITFDGVAGSWALQDALTTGSSRTVTLTNGGLDLNGFNLTAGAFSSSNANVRSITSGAGQFYCTFAASSGTSILFNADVTTNLTFADRPTINLTGNGSGTATRRIYLVVGQTEALAPDVNVTAGTDTVGAAVTTNMPMRNLNFTGFSGVLTGTLRVVYGNLTLSPTMTAAATASSTTFAATSGTQVITSNGVTLDFPIVVSAVGGTVQLADALTMAAGRRLTLTAGTFDANNKNVTTGNFTAGAGALTRVTSMGTGTWTILDAGATAWSTPAAASHTVTPSTSTILMTAATAKTFAGGGRTFWNLSNGGAGALSITGANTFNDLQNTVTPATFTLPASTTTTVSALSLAGTAGNLVTLDSSSAGTRATLSKASGTVDVSYLSIKDSAATGGATFLAVPDNGNIDAGNNTGWKFNFIDVDVSGVEALGLIAQALVWALVDDGNTVTWVEIPT